MDKTNIKIKGVSDLQLYNIVMRLPFNLTRYLTT